MDSMCSNKYCANFTPSAPWSKGKTWLEEPEAADKFELSKQAGARERTSDHMLVLVLFYLCPYIATRFFLARP